MTGQPGRRLADPARIAHAGGALCAGEWLQTQAAGIRVVCPVLPGDPEHTLWQRDSSGTNGLLSFALKSPMEATAIRFIDSLRLFQIGAS
jgi:cystathionine beta-lyase